MKFEALRSSRDAIAHDMRQLVQGALRQGSAGAAAAVPVARVSLFASMRGETYLPLTLDVKVAWVPLEHQADAVAPDAQRCATTWVQRNQSILRQHTAAHVTYTHAGAAGRASSAWSACTGTTWPLNAFL